MALVGSLQANINPLVLGIEDGCARS